ncbi:MAG: lysozyme inhibitor LprI family protein [Pseudomonadota bacterium]
MLNGILSKVVVSAVTAVAGGATWVVVEPGTRSMAAKYLGIEADSPPQAAPEPLDLTRDPAARPSFNCDDASRTIEHLICSDPALAEADVSMGRIWASLSSRGVITDELRQSQRQWLAARDACVIGEDAKACVRKAMLTRIAELSEI